MKYEKSCGALCFLLDDDAEKKVLIVQHRLGGHWAFPKGHVENNETEYDTALREVKEETGVRITILDGFRRTNTYSPAKDIQKCVVYFAAVTSQRETVPQPEEIKIAEFLPIDAAMKQLTYAPDKELLAEAVKFMTGKL